MNGDDQHVPDKSSEWQFKSEESDPLASGATESVGASVLPVTWTASEFIEHEKSFNWYVGLAIVAGLLTGTIFLVTKDKISSATILIAAIVFGVYAARKPVTSGTKKKTCQANWQLTFTRLKSAS